MKNFIIITLAAIVAVSFQFCTSPERTRAIDPPFSNVKIPFHQFEFDAAAGGRFNLSNGTTITIPANALVHGDGKPVKGKVQLNYREFHDAADIIVSGIPMQFDSGGVKYEFATAGMFEIGAEQQGRPVEIAKGKQVMVKMASYEKGEDYRFFKMDTASGVWSSAGSGRPEPNPEKEIHLAALPPAPSKPMQPAKPKNESNVFNLDVEYSAYPELKMFNNLQWEFAGTNAKASPIENEWVYEERWRNISVEAVKGKAGIYLLKLKSVRHEFTMEARPVFTGEDYDKAMTEFNRQLAAYDSTLTARAQEEEKVKLEADVYRSFPINSFGMYNWDKLQQMLANETLKMIDAEFTINGKEADEKTRIYLVSNNDKLIKIYNYEEWDKFIFDPKETNKILAILPGQKIAVFGSNGFKSISSKEFTFDLKASDAVITSSQDIRKALSAI